MLGGYQILDLRGIDLTIGTSASNITDAKVLSQLRELRNHIQKDYNFAKPLNNQLKPVLIRYRDKKNSEKHEVAIYGNLEVLTNYYTFKINAIGNGEKLSIEVVFEEKTDEYENKYWDIKTAKVLLSNDEAIGGDASIGGDLSVTGDASIGGDLSLTGDAKLFENIIDTHDNKRFIEDNISVPETTGITPDYAKWSLCGTHLMIVLALTIDDTIALTDNQTLGEVEIPKWVYDKVYPIKSDVVIFASFQGVKANWASVNFVTTLQKYSNKLVIKKSGSFTADSQNKVRLIYDLLIDND